jgi:hypothetical protein
MTSQILGASGLMNFAMLRPLLSRRVLKLMNPLFILFSFFFSGRSKQPILNPRIRGSAFMYTKVRPSGESLTNYVALMCVEAGQP